MFAGDWSIPGVFGIKKGLAKFLIDLNRLRPGTVRSSYDCIRGMRWEGGRPTLFGPLGMLMDEALIILKELNENGIGFNHPFSNMLIEERHLDDPRCNRLLALTEQPLNGVICCSELLYDYVSKHYPDFKLIGSCSANIKDPVLLKDLQQKHDLLVLPPELNREYEIIEKLDCTNLEVLVNEECVPHCSFKSQHYEMIARMNLTFDHDIIEKFLALYAEHAPCQHDKSHELFLKNTEVQRLKSIGIRHFKIQGRLWGQEQFLVKSIMRYVLKPLYLDKKEQECLLEFLK